jgi:uncharacterized protein (UPF0179 family)
MRAFRVVVMVRSGEKRCFLREDSDIVRAVVVEKYAMGVLIAVAETRSVGRAFPRLIPVMR